MEIKSYDPARKAEVLDLIRLCLGEKPDIQRDPRWWDWRHEENPFGQSLILTAEIDGRIVGVRPFLRWQLRCGDRVLNAVKPVDTVTHPDCRRQGIFTKLTRAALDQARQEGVDLLFNTPNESSMPGYLKMGWKHVAGLPLYAKPLRPIGMLKRVLSSRLGWKSPAQAARQTTHGEDASAVEKVLHNLDGAVSLDRPWCNGDLNTPRTADFLRWRYLRHPHATYHAEVEEREGHTLGAILYRTKQRGPLRELLLDDIIVSPERPEVVDLLLKRLCRNTAADYVVAHFPAHSPFRETLKRHGFWRVPRRRINLVARGLDDGVVSAGIEAQTWSLTLADIEGL